MTELEYLLVLNSVPDVGYVRIKNLIARFGGIEGVFKATKAQLEETDKIGPKIAAAIAGCDKEKVLEAELKLAAASGARIISYLDDEYPANLKQIYDPPAILYVKGAFAPEDKFSAAIVGSRRASRYGLQTAERFGMEFAARGITVVSGLARGIDAAGHKGALKARGRTVAVLGSGLANIYPPEHIELAGRIIDGGGAIVSEFPMACEPYKDNFPRRNRIISGLSLGVVVVEAAKGSGALITTDFALEQGRELFAVPGNAGSATSAGTNMLIKQGAKLVESADDVIEELGDMIKGHMRARVTQAVRAPSLEGTQKAVFESLGDMPVSVDEIIDGTELAAPEAIGALVKLEILGLVERLPGQSYVRKGTS
ncbi:MAG: DNA-processing protein DprA [Candidatus Omnitrophota bacterium]